ncbi:MAG TPA: hypothetical protein VM925_26275 [Labilithrix sp.]|nr:hypothetical protein [Labilithrix sp.]
MKDQSARTLEPTTVPPPAGAKDMYSAQTRVGSLPEEVLAAMRTEESDAGLAARTQSGMRRAVRPVEPPTPSARPSLRPETPEPFSAVRPRSQPPFVTAPTPLAVIRPSFAPPPSFEVTQETPPPPSSLVRSIAIVALFAMLGALVAWAIMFDFG